MPRSENDAWKEFHVTTDANGKKLSMTCRHCLKIWQKSNATRCTEHLPKCPKLPINLRRAYGFERSQAGDSDDPPEQPRDGAGAANSAGKSRINFKLFVRTGLGHATLSGVTLVLAACPVTATVIFAVP